MKTPFYIRLFLGLSLYFLSFSTAFSQKTIFEILNRDDLTFEEVKTLANSFIDSQTDVFMQNRARKHFERWKFERKFHLDKKGYKISPLIEQATFRANSKTSPLSVTSAWVELGPRSWTRTTGWNPGVGRVTSVAVNPTNTNIIYVSSPGGGIWKTIDEGANWTPLVDGNSAYMNVFNLAISPSNTNVIYAAATGVGVIKSVDAGVTWTMTGTTSFNPKKVLVHPTNSNKVFVTTPVGIFESADGGTSWTQRLMGVDVEDIEFKTDDPMIMFSSGNSANTTTIHRSVDGGITWTAITSGITNGNGRTLLGVTAANSNVVYAVQAEGDAFGRLYKSTDGGNNFTTTVTGNIANSTNYFGYTGTTEGGQAGYDMAIAVNPTDANDLSIAGIVVWRSTDGGTSFNPATVWSLPNSVGYNHADVHALEYIGTTLYSGSDGGIYRTAYAAPNTWTDLSTGLGIRQFYRIANAPTHAVVWGGGAQDNGTTTRQAGGNFVDWLGADGMDMIIDPTNHLNMIGTSQNGTIYKTTDGGNTQTLLTRPANGNWITPLWWHNATTVYGGWNSVYKNTTAGDGDATSWVNIGAGITGGNINDLAVAPSNDQYIYASIENKLWVTTNGGTSWTSYTYPDFITDIHVKYNNPQKIWVTTTSTTQPVVLSTNAGATFTNISAGLPALAARSIVVDDNASESVYVGMNLGVYYRNLGNPTWVLFGTGLPQVAINEVELSKIGGKLRVGTYGRGLWEIDTPNCQLTLAYGNINQAAGTYSATETITSQANVATPTNYYAGKSISLNPPFSAGPNEVFVARIQGCN